MNERETRFLIVLKNKRESERSETQESSDAVKTLLLSTCTYKVRGHHET